MEISVDLKNNNFKIFKNMDVQKKNKITSRNQMKIIVDFSLLKMLSANKKKLGKFTRVQALCDLIERQYITSLQEDGEYLKGSVLDFARTWGWDRDTVARFLNELELLGIVSSLMNHNRKNFKVNYVTDEEIDSLAPAKLAEPIKESLATHFALMDIKSHLSA